MPERFTKNCPKCGKEQSYYNKKSRNRAEKLKKWCSSCRQKEISKRPETIKKRKAVDRWWMRGENNHFYGKHHTEESKQKIGTNNAKYIHIRKTKEYREKMSLVTKGSKNPMYGRTVYSIWLEKYGKEEADKRLVAQKVKLSKASSGKNNPMYGKPTPTGSGNGWSGWYKGWYFRSLRELSYVVLVLEKGNKTWISAEKHRIKYLDFNKKERTYAPDFLVENQYLIEIKPEKLMHTPNNLLKKAAAEEFCAKNSLVYKMVDIKIMPFIQIRELYDSHNIKWNRSTQKRYEKYLEKYDRTNNENV